MVYGDLKYESNTSSLAYWTTFFRPGRGSYIFGDKVITYTSINWHLGQINDITNILPDMNPYNLK